MYAQKMKRMHSFLAKSLGRRNKVPKISVIGKGPLKRKRIPISLELGAPRTLYYED